MTQAVMKWTVVGEVLIAHTTEGPIADSDWDAFVRDIRTKPITRFLGASTGPTEVSSTQRRSASEALMAKNILVAVVTDEGLVRGVVTAASWLGVNIKSFSWADLKKGVEYLGAKPADVDRVTKALLNLKAASVASKDSRASNG